MKKILSVVLTFAMLLTALSVVTVSAVTSGDTKVVSVDGTEMTLSAFIADAATNNYEGKTLTLLTDVVLSGEWGSIPEFKGTLNGNGKSISGLTAPLFAKLDGATVKNLTLNGTITYEGNQCGALTCLASGTVTLENCVNNCNINFTQTGSDASGAGLVGFASGKLTAVDCVNNGNVAASSTNKVSVDVGGIVGYVKGSDIELVATRCVNNGKLTTNVIDASGKNSSTGIIGGIAAWVLGPATFTDCLNTGALETVSAVGQGGHKVGGIVGVLNSTSSSYVFVNCVNTGNVFGYCQAAGVVAESQSSKLTIQNCYNYGTMTTGGTTVSNVNSMAAGIIAYQRKGTAVVEACANYGAVTAKCNNTATTAVYASGIVALTDTPITVTGCSNRAAVSSGRIAGGLFGYVNKDGGAIDINDCFVSEAVSLLENKLENALAGALIGSINKGNVTLTNTRHLTTVNAKSFNGTVTNAADSVYTVANEAEWRALCEINYEGLQYTAAANGKFNVRLVASLSSLDYLNAGYEVIRIVNGEIGSVDAEINTVYKSLNGFDESGSKTEYLASDFNAEYLAALVIKNVPADQTVTFVVRPYLMNTEGTATIYGDSYTVTFVNGVLAN